MGLRNLVIPTELVKISDGEGFAVRGLSPNDAIGLYHRHAGQLSTLFDQFSKRAKAAEATSVLEVGTAMVSGAPQIMAEIVALASDSDPNGDDWTADVAVALRLPAGVQMDALEKIGRLTFTSDMPAPKFFGLVLEMAKSATAVMTPPKVV